VKVNSKSLLEKVRNKRIVSKDGKVPVSNLKGAMYSLLSEFNSIKLD